MAIKTFNNFLASSRRPFLVPFGLFPSGSDLSWIASYGSVPPMVTPSGTVDGVNATFSTGVPFSDAWVFLNGQLQTPGVDYTVDPTGGLIVFQSASVPRTGDKVLAMVNTAYSSSTSVVGAPTAETPLGVIDGVNTSFSLSRVPTLANVFLNGIKLKEGTGFARVGAVIVFQPGYIPTTGDVMEAELW